MFFLAVRLGGQCSKHHSGTAGECVDENSICSNHGFCKCNVPDFVNGPVGGCISRKNKAKYGHSCGDSNDCFYNMQCVENRCQCPLGMGSIERGFKCKTNRPGDFCSYNSDCISTPNAICQNGKCTCSGNNARTSTFIKPNGEFITTCINSETPLLDEGDTCQPYINQVSVPARVCGPMLICSPCDINDYRCLRKSLPLKNGNENMKKQNNTIYFNSSDFQCSWFLQCQLRLFTILHKQEL